MIDYKLEGAIEEYIKNHRAEYDKVGTLVTDTAKNFKVKNKQVIDYIDFLIEEGVIPDIYKSDFVENNFVDKYLDASGEDW
mgnify:CR=1 FL=1